MQREIKKRWISALLSKKYPQHEWPMLRSIEGYAPLGVLYEILGGKWVKEFPDDYYYLSESGSYATITPGMANEVGLDFATQHEIIALSGAGYSFEEVATYVEHILDEYD